MQLFHVRHRKLLILSAIGGIYLPGLSRIIPWKFVNTFLKVYTAAVTAGILILAICAMRYTIFLADNLIIRLVLLNNICDHTLAFSRAIFFNVNRNEAQALYDLWDVYFTGDGHDDIRKEILEKLKRPYKKYIIVGGVIMYFMSISWAVAQFGNENCDFSVPMGIPFHNRNPEYLFWVTFLFVMLLHKGPMVIAADMLIMEPMSWITAEFMRLKLSLGEIINTIKIRENGEIIQQLNKHELVEGFQQVDEKIKKWIMEHQKLLIFHQKMITVNNWPLTMQLFCTTFTICLLCYLSVTKAMEAFALFVTALVYLPNFYIFYFMAKYGDFMKKLASDVFDSAFAKNWSIYPKHMQRSLHIIATRANYPLIVNMMKHYPLNSETYFQIVQTAFSFYNFLLFVTIQEDSI